MAYVAPTTQGAGTGLSSTSWNVQVNNTLFFALKPFISARRTTTQSIANNSASKVAWLTTDRATSVTLGTDGTTASVRFTPTVAGWYHVDAYVGMVVSTGVSLILLKNGSQDRRTDNVGANASQGTILTSYVLMNGSTDYLELQVYQNSGSAQNVIAGSRFTMSWDRFDT